MVREPSSSFPITTGVACGQQIKSHQSPGPLLLLLALSQHNLCTVWSVKLACSSGNPPNVAYAGKVLFVSITYSQHFNAFDSFGMLIHANYSVVTTTHISCRSGNLPGFPYGDKALPVHRIWHVHTDAPWIPLACSVM